MDPVDYLSPEEFWARNADLDARVREMAASAAVFFVRDWTGPVLLSEWAFAPQGPRGLLHGDPAGAHLLVQTGPADLRLAVCSLRMTAAGGRHADADMAERLFQTCDTPPDGVVEITVEDTPVLFDTWHDGDIWWAAGTYREHPLVLEGAGLPDAQLALGQVVDIEPYLAGRRALMRRERGED